MCVIEIESAVMPSSVASGASAGSLGRGLAERVGRREAARAIDLERLRRIAARRGRVGLVVGRRTTRARSLAAASRAEHRGDQRASSRFARTCATCVPPARPEAGPARIESHHGRQCQAHRRAQRVRCVDFAQLGERGTRCATSDRSSSRATGTRRDGPRTTCRTSSRRTASSTTTSSARSRRSARLGPQATQENRSLFSKEGSRGVRGRDRQRARRRVELGGAHRGARGRRRRRRGAVPEQRRAVRRVRRVRAARAARRRQPRVRPLAASTSRTTRPGRRAALAMLTVHDLDATVAEIAWARDERHEGRDHPDRSRRRASALLRPVLRPDVGRVPRPRAARAHPRRERHARLRRLRRGQHADLRDRDRVLRAPAAVVPDLGRRARTVPHA